MLNVLIGFISGIVSGMGIGGGAILIPALVLFGNVNQQTAQGINLVYFIPTAITALIIHIRNKKRGNKNCPDNREFRAFWSGFRLIHSRTYYG